MNKVQNSIDPLSKFNTPESYFEESLNIFQNLYGKEHLSIALVLTNMGKIKME